MADNGNIVNFPATGDTVAPLKNVTLFSNLLQALANRHHDLPGFGVFYGPAGLGKTMASIYSANKSRAHIVECDYTWTQKAFVEAVMAEIGILYKGSPTRTPIYRAVGEIGDYFAANPDRPLIIDEADFLIKRKMIEIVRAIYKYCAPAGASIILIGEENMPKALSLWERFDSRILMRVMAVPLDLVDFGKLAALICPGISFSDAAMKKLCGQAGGSARRAVTRLHGLLEQARENGLDEITLASIDGAEIGGAA